MKKICSLLLVLLLWGGPVMAFPKGGTALNYFNGGKWQINPNFPAIGYMTPSPTCSRTRRVGATEIVRRWRFPAISIPMDIR